ncbi:MAG: HEPN domain-containing protein [Planctomycetes bacterium]|nr:HEPN domain-containing protein [Planctomycetota bacterium]
MKDKVDHARGWFRKADSDLADARRTVSSEGPFDTACFHAQQAVEKLLKGLLAYLEQPIPKSHDVEELQRLCLHVIPAPDLARLDLTPLSDYAVPARYDLDFWPDRGTAAEALSLALQVRDTVLSSVPPGARP